VAHSTALLYVCQGKKKRPRRRKGGLVKEEPALQLLTQEESVSTYQKRGGGVGVVQGFALSEKKVSDRGGGAPRPKKGEFVGGKKAERLT